MQQTASHFATAPDHESLRGKRVLVLEDDDCLFHALRDSLHDAGCHALGACDRVCQPLDTVPASHLDAALIDMDPIGLERAASVALQLCDRAVPILLITARSRADLPRILRPHGKLLKPFTEREFLDGMVRAMGLA